MTALRVSAAIIWLTTAMMVAAFAQSAVGLLTDSDAVGGNTFATADCFAGDSGFLDPAAEAADSGGDGNGFESSPTNAFANDAAFASNIDGAGDRHRYYNYAVAVGGCSINGIEVQLDWYLDDIGGTSDMGVELSWDGGTSWTAAKTDAVESTTEHTTVLGGASDTWGRSWTASEMSDANFRVRLTSNSTDSLRDFFLDWVPVKVHVSSSTCITGDTGYLSPSAEGADSGGDGNGFESSPTNAFADDAAFASNINGKDDRHRYYNYGISVDSTCTVTGIEVRLDWWLDSISQSNSMSVDLSWDGGTSWTAAKTDATETIVEHTAVLGGTADSWSRTWTLSELNDANFRLRIESGCSGQPTGCNTRDYFLDWVAVKVHYAP